MCFWKVKFGARFFYGHRFHIDCAIVYINYGAGERFCPHLCRRRIPTRFVQEFLRRFGTLISASTTLPRVLNGPFRLLTLENTYWEYPHPRVAAGEDYSDDAPPVESSLDDMTDNSSDEEEVLIISSDSDSSSDSDDIIEVILIQSESEDEWVIISSDEEGEFLPDDESEELEDM